jgi:hypothetical protein
MSILRTLALTLSLWLAASAVVADVLVVDHVAGTTATEKPGNGMSMDDVLARFGQPMERLAPVGEPPITQWVYDRFVVYFEYNLVIHSVTKR